MENYGEYAHFGPLKFEKIEKNVNVNVSGNMRNIYLEHKNKYSFLARKTHTGILAQDSFQPLFLHSCWQHWCQKKRNTSRNSNFWVWSATFHPGLKNSWKTIKVHKNQHFFDGFSKFIQFWLKSSGSNQQIWIPWCFLLLLIPMLTSEVEK